MEATEQTNSKTVLLAEEDEQMREELADELREDGYQVITVEDGFELCDYLDLAHHSEGKLPNPDVIISDVELSGWGGMEICRRMAGEENLPFILLAPDDPDTWEDAERAGAAHVLDKPVNHDDLLDAVACYAEGP
jgi:CheY-like chemotaxis protein